MVSQNCFALVCMGMAQFSHDGLRNEVLHGYVCANDNTKVGLVPLFGGVLSPLRTYRAIWGIAEIVSKYCAIWNH